MEGKAAGGHAAGAPRPRLRGVEFLPLLATLWTNIPIIN